MIVEDTPEEAIVRFDGGARPNPGAAAVGCWIDGDGWSEEYSDTIGTATNNQAEYMALIRSLKVAQKENVDRVEVEGDSQLVVKQVSGDWNTDDSELRELRNRAQELANQFEYFSIKHVPRKANKKADELVDQALCE
ncbi:ribonuclease HI family protein [Haloarcula sp. 1CSR25-25]|jgi:ribonuclease HI|uniref:ribonuclease HI family protein n=1 Tax=Haloarcula sp. 1CSR25-25 TaxID=2862545 RepID=UPI0028957C23|nr:ribonuclease HI family protein [Haloarcula sp. 1CSR25-25]MDT3437874.1 ribonuclease HI family protein [Haloarcula sp. 1CSR25-25]